VNVVPTSHDFDEILPLYKRLKGKHRKLIIQRLHDQIEIKNESDKLTFFLCVVGMIDQKNETKIDYNGLIID
jgi:hypothetical protein